MQGLLSRLVPLVTTQPKSCSGSNKGPSRRRHWIAMDEQVQQRDLRACACVYLSVCACVCVWTTLMWIITLLVHQCPWVSEKSLQILIFADKAQCQGGRNEFYFKAVSHSTDYIPLHLRWLHTAQLSSCTDNMWRLSPNFTAWLIMQRCYGGNLLLLRVCAWGYCVHIAWTKVAPYYIHIFHPADPKLLKKEW